MRLGINALHVRPHRGGVGHYVAGLVEGILRQPEFQPGGDSKLFLFATPETAPLYARDHSNFDVVAWGPPGESVGRRRLREWTSLHRAIAAREIDVWLGASNFLPLFRPADCALVLTLHDVSYWLYPDRVGLAKRLYWKAWTRRSLSLADAFVTASEHARATICATLGLAPERFVIIHHAAAERFSPDAEAHRAVDGVWRVGGAPWLDPLLEAGAKPWDRLAPGSYVLSICTLEPGKNLPGLVRAFAALKRGQAARDPRIEKLKLALAGGAGWKNEELFAAIDEEGIRDDVAMLGYVPDHDLPRVLNGAAAFAFFSLNEGFGLPPLEAMSCGVPVACSSASSLPEVVGDAAAMADPNDVASMRGALERALLDPKERARLRAAGVARAAEFSWEKAARETLDVCRRAVAGRARA
jgi:glycosyltransferase involved in cell wall biosynthesis